MDSSDGLYDDFDSAVLDQLDAIEAEHAQPPASSNSRSIQPKATRLSPNVSRSHGTGTGQESDPFDLTFDVDEAELQRLDTVIEDAYTNPRTIAGPSAFQGASSRAPPSTFTRQATLTGDVLANRIPNSQKNSSGNRFGSKPAKTKKWDHTAFAKTGRRPKVNGKDKGKERDSFDEEEENVEFEQFPAPFINPECPPPKMKLKPDLLAARNWIYPLNNELRDYQFNIVNHSLFENALVALPTGLGKTFIAGVIMLNYYRWFPDGKVVFVAPTKPLVAQQIEASHKVCGIPGFDAAELTGEVSRAARNSAWATKRVFYMTPQTLMNDLQTGNCDCRDLILLVIDEAHKATGDYAYAKVVRFLMSKNPHIRILALTATPGSKPEAVQALVDALHISHIEIRDEKSMDLRKYMHKKHTEVSYIRMNDAIRRIQNPLVEVMESQLKPLAKCGIFHNQNPILLHPYRCTAMIGEAVKDRSRAWAVGYLKTLSSLARAMGYLMEQSVSMCYNSLQELLQGVDQKTGAPKKTSAQTKSKLLEQPAFRALMAEIEAQRNRGFVMHPKMEMLKTLTIQHFATAEMAAEEAGGPSSESGTRAMVFASFRDCVDEIVECLNQESPMIRAARFIGQSSDKQGRKGYNQKEQLEVIKKFKEGVFNVLVATSIGEEGLDIGEVDLIVCYDAQKTPIRMLQRIGRTGRKRDGHVRVLLAEGREENNWNKAKESYADVQQTIVRGTDLELYGDVPRLLPDNVKPECMKMVMEIEEYAKPAPRLKDNVVPKTAKRKPRDSEVSRNIPEGASTGFVSVADLIVKGKGKKVRKRASTPTEARPLTEDEVDLEIEAGLDGWSPRATSSKNSKKPPSKSSAKGKAKASSSTTKKAPNKATSKRAVSKPEDDSDSPVEIVPDSLEGFTSAKHLLSKPRSASPASASSPPFKHPRGSLSPNYSIARSGPSKPKANLTEKTKPSNMSWLLESDDSDMEVLGSPALSPSREHGSITDEDLPPAEDLHISPRRPVSFRKSPLSHVPEEKKPRKMSMPPPLPTHLSSPSSSFDIRAPGQNRKRPINVADNSIFMSPTKTTSPSQQPVIDLSSPVRPRPRKRRKQEEHLLKKGHAYLETEAMLSGTDKEGGTSDSEGEESESDRRFAGDFQPTQAPAGYDQAAAYRQSLMTQVPAGGPVFRRGPVRTGPFAGGRNNRTRLLVSSSPRGENEEPDEYEMDSFVVGDDEEVEYSATSSDI